MHSGLHVKYPLLLSDFNKNRIFSRSFKKALKYQVSLNSVQWKASCFMWTDGRTDGQKERQTGRKTDRQAERQRDRQKDRRT